MPFGPDDLEGPDRYYRKQQPQQQQQQPASAAPQQETSVQSFAGQGEEKAGELFDKYVRPQIGPTLGYAAGQFGRGLLGPDLEHEFLSPSPQPPNRVAETLGAMSHSIGENPIAAMMFPVTAPLSAAAGDIVHQYAPDSKYAPAIAGLAVGGIAGAPKNAGTLLSSLLGYDIGARGSHALYNALTHAGYDIAPETAHLLGPLLGVSLPHLWNILKSPRAWLSGGIGAYEGQRGANDLSIPQEQHPDSGLRSLGSSLYNYRGLGGPSISDLVRHPGPPDPGSVWPY